ncbi:hypothetical protein FDUTEX481_05093 [Tolypothrix sp. PCC 7601]|nr:hypothetical protein FDUTEX481_05093 [Tolypothrix sp. PCC 7601]
MRYAFGVTHRELLKWGLDPRLLQEVGDLLGSLSSGGALRCATTHPTIPQLQLF